MSNSAIEERSAIFRQVIERWVAHISPEQLADQEYRDAISAIDTALEATIAYLGGKRGAITPERISKLWRTAGVAVGPLDAELSNACGMKGYGWIKPDQWKRARAQGVKIGVQDMQDALLALTAKRPSIARATVPKWFPIAGVACAGVTILFLMYWLLLGPQFDPQKKIVFDVLTALSVASSAAFLGGTAVASGRLPWFKNSPIQFSAAGGIAIFIVVLIVMRKMT